VNGREVKDVVMGLVKGFGLRVLALLAGKEYELVGVHIVKA